MVEDNKPDDLPSLSQELSIRLRSIRVERQSDDTVTIKGFKAERQRLKGLMTKIRDETGIRITQTEALALALDSNLNETRIKELLKIFKQPSVRTIAKNSPSARREIIFGMNWHKSMMFSFLKRSLQDEWLITIDFDPKSFGDRFKADYSDPDIDSFIKFVRLMKISNKLDEYSAKKAERHAIKYVIFKDMLSDYLDNLDKRFMDEANAIAGVKLKLVTLRDNNNDNKSGEKND